MQIGLLRFLQFATDIEVIFAVIAGVIFALNAIAPDRILNRVNSALRHLHIF